MSDKSIAGWEFGREVCKRLGLDGVTGISIDSDVCDIVRIHITMVAPESIIEVADLIDVDNCTILKNYTAPVQSCARCGKDHDVVHFSPLTRPCEGWTHYGMCPSTGEPIMLKMVETEEDSNA